ncbi:hypothetical protein [Gordonia neofelifaecis]|uniref:DUF4178 domain-containing protein n=2 Tax=Gordoniaceae TaxID=85026 RepID=F1YM23_9ACTN|nr:hypothetical protein [Gordonia neofelifaecis]EGD54274.1 hypothetical protein SCNU_14836 [Gordonia neofelifaecis NRRL B-59395]
MGLFDKLTGTKKPAAGTPARSPQEVANAIMAVNRPTAPFQIRPARSDEGCDFVAEWRIVDARWYEVFAKASLTSVFQILLKLDPAQHEVRAVDREWTVEWRAGVPSLSMKAEAFRGQKVEASFGTAYAFTEQGQYGQVYNYRFRTGEIKEPIQDAVTGAGWTYKGVSFGKL